MTPADALALLARLGAPPRLIRHHELVLEAAVVLLDRLRDTIAFDRALVLAGVALHDAGKILHPRELDEPGHTHEDAGRALLAESGVPETIARFCVTHAAPIDLEDHLVALADKLWKGKRDEAIEARVVELVAAATARPAWDAFTAIDAICEEIAAGGPRRLARSIP